MNAKTITGIIIIAIFLVVGFFSFSESKIEYTNFQTASEIHKTCQVKGSWIKNKEAKFDANTNEFVFYMMDENNTEMKVVLAGARPNNFEMAENAINLLHKNDAEHNTKTAHFLNTNIALKTGYDSQAMIELYDNYCTKKRCLDCRIGNKILRKVEK